MAYRSFGRFWQASAPATIRRLLRPHHPFSAIALYAAGMVVFFHAAIYLQAIKGNSWGIEAIPMWFGADGVYLFFAISGYLMAKTMKRSSWDIFVIHRMIRIYPTFFIVVILFYFASFITGIYTGFNWQGLILTPMGTQAGYPLQVEWTLVFEIAFYAVVAIIILFNARSYTAVILIVWLCSVLMAGILFPEKPVSALYPPYRLLFSVHCVGFITGMLFPLIMPERLIPRPVLAVLIGMIINHIAGPYGEIPARWATSISYALLVLSVASRPLWKGWSWPAINMAGNRLGAYTYALYLVHVPVLRTVYGNLAWTEPTSLITAGILSCVLLAVLVGELDVFLYEWIKQRADFWPSHLRTGLASGFMVLFFATALFASVVGS